MKSSKQQHSVAPATVLQVKVHARARRAGIDGMLGDTLKLSVTEPPEGGKANAAVKELLARSLGVRETSITILAGASSPRKTVCIEGLSAETVAVRLGGLAEL